MSHDDEVTITLGQLRGFIADVESHSFRTLSDMGANPNAMYVWNLLRAYVDLPKLTELDLMRNHERILWQDYQRALQAWIGSGGRSEPLPPEIQRALDRWAEIYEVTSDPDPEQAVREWQDRLRAAERGEAATVWSGQ